LAITSLLCAEMSSKPNVLVLGGLGFIGRNLVEFLVDKQLTSKIRVADKVLPDLAGLSQKQAALFKGDQVEFKQANLAREAMVNKVFDDGGNKWDFVFNLAGETKYSQTDEVYKENILDLSVTCGNAAAKRGVSRFIEVSTAQIYDAGKKPSDETDKPKPWTKLAKAKLQAEEALRNIKGLNLIFVRPCIIYGPGDVGGITPRVIAAAVYKQLGETMEFLWDKDLKINTVHVRDVVSALWHLTTNGTVGEVYNLADRGDTDQGTVGKVLESIFKIKTSYMGNIKSKVATAVAMKTVAETANEKHLKPWSDLCKAKGIVNTPLTPYLDEELLYNNSYSVDGNKITKTGFAYQYPAINEELLRESINYFIDLGFFPKDFI
jgi:nucleoside-diphosphate-sugar epimerase